jgi:hypothetical protein
MGHRIEPSDHSLYRFHLENALLECSRANQGTLPPDLSFYLG